MPRVDENNGDINDTYRKFFRVDKKWIIIARLLIVREFVLLRFSGGSRFEHAFPGSTLPNRALPRSPA